LLKISQTDEIVCLKRENVKVFLFDKLRKKIYYYHCYDMDRWQRIGGEKSEEGKNSKQ